MSAPYRLRAPQPTEGTERIADVLGPHVRTFYGAAHRGTIVAITPFALLLVTIGWIAHQGQITHWFNSTFSAVTVCMLLVIAIAVIMRTAAVGGGEMVRVHKGGLLDLRAGPRAVSWDEIESLTAVSGTAREGIVRHVLRTQDGAVLSLGKSIGGVVDLIDEVRTRMIEHAGPGLRARVDEGGEVRFGPLAVTERGIALGPRVVAWDEVKDIEAEGHDVVVRGTKGERLATARLDDVPNAFLLAEIAHARRRR